MITKMNELIEMVKSDVKAEMDIAVVGLSGGVDSLVCATLATLALGPENVYTVHMPYNDIDIMKFNANSIRIGTKLGTRNLMRPIHKIADAINEEFDNDDEYGFENQPLSELNKGNSRSRARMTVLYKEAHHIATVTGKSVRVLGTGNLSEDFIGYDTKGGDALADLFLIGELLKSEVYQLAEHFVEMGLIEKDMIDYHPSAGLWDGQSDEEELGFTYAAMEPSVLKLRNPETGLAHYGYETVVNGINANRTEMDNFVLDRHFKNRHKHMAPPAISLREFCE